MRAGKWMQWGFALRQACARNKSNDRCRGLSAAAPKRAFGGDDDVSVVGKSVPAKWCVLLLGAVGAAASAQAPAAIPAAVHVPFPGGGTPLAVQVESLLGETNVARDHWGIAVTALDGTPIYGHDEGRLFRPASNAKLFTTAAAMELLKPETQLTTHVTFRAPLADGSVRNDVLLEGVGDANFSDTEFPYQSAAKRRAAAAALGKPMVTPDALRYFDELAAKMVARGVKRVEGDVIASDLAWTWEPYPESWSIDDMTWGYGAPVSTFAVEDNELQLKVYPGAAVGDAARAMLLPVASLPDKAYYEVQVDVRTVAKESRASVDVARMPGSRVLRVYGTIAVGGSYSTEIAVDDPAEFAAMALKQRMEAHGITVTGIAKPTHLSLTDAGSLYRESHEPVMPGDALRVMPQCFDDCVEVTHVSPALGEDVVYTLKESQNLHAEMLLRRLGAAFGRQGHDGDVSTSAQGMRVVRQFLVNQGIDGEDFLLVDGSGLSAHDLVAPRAAVKLLAYARTRHWFTQWFAGLPVGGQDGTLRARFPDEPLKDHVFAKTGTLGESRALSGYVDCASGKQVIFSIMVDDHSPGTAADRATMDLIVAAIAATN